MNLWTPKQVAEYLSVRLQTVYAWAKQGAIPYIILSRGRRKECIRFRSEDIEDWVKNNERKARPR
jgi:excisionase family DNA binding protein